MTVDVTHCCDERATTIHRAGSSKAFSFGAVQPRPTLSLTRARSGSTVPAVLQSDGPVTELAITCSVLPSALRNRRSGVRISPGALTKSPAHGSYRSSRAALIGHRVAFGSSPGSRSRAIATSVAPRSLIDERPESWRCPRRAASRRPSSFSLGQKHKQRRLSPDVALEPTTPFLTMEGRGCFERSQTLTGGHEVPANRLSLVSVQSSGPWAGIPCWCSESCSHGPRRGGGDL